MENRGHTLPHSPGEAKNSFLWIIFYSNTILIRRLFQDPHTLFKSSQDNVKNALGFCSAILSRDLAGPLGFLLPCSQSCKVLTLTPIKFAKAICESFNFSLIVRGGEGSDSREVFRERFPFLYSFISLTPSRISSPIFLSTIFDLLYNLFKDMRGDVFFFILHYTNIS